MTVSTYAASWLDTMLPRLRRSTAEQYASILEHHVKPDLGHVYLDELTTMQLRTWLAATSKKLKKNGQPCSPETTNSRLRYLKGLLETACADGLINRNPAARVKSLPDTRQHVPKQALTAEELGRVLALAKIHEPLHAAMIEFKALTGARFSEYDIALWSNEQPAPKMPSLSPRAYPAASVAEADALPCQ